jgi:hypothetical protein
VGKALHRVEEEQGEDGTEEENGNVADEVAEEKVGDDHWTECYELVAGYCEQLEKGRFAHYQEPESAFLYASLKYPQEQRP